MLFGWGGEYSAGVLMPVVAEVVPPRDSTHDLQTVPRPGQVPGVEPAVSGTGSAGPVVPVKREVTRGYLVPEGTGRAPATGTSVLITATETDAAFELMKSCSYLRSSSLGSSVVVHPPEGTEVPGTVR